MNAVDMIEKGIESRKEDYYSKVIEENRRKLEQIRRKKDEKKNVLVQYHT